LPFWEVNRFWQALCARKSRACVSPIRGNISLPFRVALSDGPTVDRVIRRRFASRRDVRRAGDAGGCDVRRAGDVQRVGA